MVTCSNEHFNKANGRYRTSYVWLIRLCGDAHLWIAALLLFGGLDYALSLDDSLSFIDRQPKLCSELFGCCLE